MIFDLRSRTYGHWSVISVLNIRLKKCVRHLPWNINHRTFESYNFCVAVHIKKYIYTSTKYTSGQMHSSTVLKFVLCKYDYACSDFLWIVLLICNCALYTFFYYFKFKIVIVQRFWENIMFLYVFFIIIVFRLPNLNWWALAFYEVPLPLYFYFNIKFIYLLLNNNFCGFIIPFLCEENVRILFLRQNVKLKIILLLFCHKKAKFTKVLW